MQLLADLYLFLVDETPQVLRREPIECMTCFAREALETIATYILSEKDDGFKKWLYKA